jgi:manganese transport protein
VELGKNSRAQGQVPENMSDARARTTADAGTLAAAGQVLGGGDQRRGLKRLLPFLGPAFIASIAYVDPGNFATNIQAGAQYGYLLLWVVVASNLMAMLVQTLAAKLGIATGRNLAELCREQFSPWVVWVMWALMEIVAMATDLAEFLGAAVGFNLLFGVPLWIAGLMTAAFTFLLLGLERRGFRPLEAAITAFVGVIAVCYLIETLLGHPDWTAAAFGSVLPKFHGAESILLATGILGATVMPHVIFLHSALTQGRIVTREPAQLRKLFRFQVADVAIAMSIAGLINMAMLIMAAATFFKAGMHSVGTIEEAYKTLEPLLGKAAGVIFAISLLASGLSSSSVGTLAGQVIMQGFLRRHIPVWVRRLVTLLPSLVVIWLGCDPTRTLVLSQVVLSFGLPFAVIPLVLFTRRRDLMGILVNCPLTTAIAWAVAALIVTLNLYLIWQTFFGGTGHV